ncbi:MAG TPA: carboxylesterase family protein [Hyphomonadaceae bacterium]|jgi:para-nitrobenzyl esterase|nr:carboxylesterase family protein [Hyphomonadaceae bacterium]
MITRRLFTASTAGLILTPVSSAAPMRKDPQVSIASGKLKGRARGEVAEFLGVPYGADTRFVRFQPPVAAAPWKGARDALAFGPASPQGGGESNQSEDCLVLNIWTPTLERNAKKPVLVYIHGGGYSGGSGSSPVTDGAELARRGDAVVLTLNHRLNLFAHLYLAKLREEAFAASGNAGLLDLVLALSWVRDNIAAFGGDPDCVTVFGQSGGGGKIACLMAMPAAKGLFHRAWTMSGQQVTAQGPKGATARAKAFIEQAGSTARGLSDLTKEQLLAAMAARDPSIVGSRVYWGPVLDEVSLPVHPFWPDAPKQSSAMPMVMGNTREETGSLIAMGDPSVFQLSWDTLPAKLEGAMVTDIDVGVVIRTYRGLFPQITPPELFIKATTAGRSWRAQVIEAEARAREQGPTWVYQLNFRNPREGGRFGAHHTLDIPLVFANTAKSEAETGNGPDAQRTSITMSDAFLRFARSGDPSGGSLGAWPRYDLARRATMIFDADSRVEDDPRKAERELFAKAPYIQPGAY